MRQVRATLTSLARLTGSVAGCGAGDKGDAADWRFRWMPDPGRPEAASLAEPEDHGPMNHPRAGVARLLLRRHDSTLHTRSLAGSRAGDLGVRSSDRPSPVPMLEIFVKSDIRKVQKNICDQIACGRKMEHYSLRFKLLKKFSSEVQRSPCP
jgi:hypothetical protein